MTLKQYQVDAFTTRLFGGNPAAVVPLDAWLDDALLQSIAAENNLSETAFFVPQQAGFHLRWFTPVAEVTLCGHATLATAWVLFNALDYASESIRFETLSGPLTVTRAGERLSMDFPAWTLDRLDTLPTGLAEALGREPVEVLGVSTRDNLFAVFDSERDVRALKPDMRGLAALHPAGVVATAPGDTSDIASRYFVPSYGIDEDPVTGSIHCGLTPYWCERMDTDRLHARQVSAREGDLWCRLLGTRVAIEGHAVGFLEGRIALPTC